VNPPATSIVVRTFNEGRRLRRVLQKLYGQTFRDFELIIVDNSSTDETLAVIRDLPVAKLVSIPSEKFGHGFSLNLGVFAASANLVVLTNGHCVPCSEYWLEAGLDNFREAPVAAVTGNYSASSDGSIWERLYDLRQIRTLYLRQENLPITTTNAIIRRDLWLEYQFDEDLPQCEDYDWSREMIARGFKTVKDPRFNVYHSHGLSLSAIRSRERQWKTISAALDSKERPSTCQSIVFRKGLEDLGIVLQRPTRGKA